MANETTLSTLDDLIVPMIAEALFVASEASIMRPLVRNYALPKNSGKVIQVPIYPVVAAAAVAEATDLANTAISTSKADLTVAEVGVMTTVTDMAVNTAESDVIKDLGKLFGEGIARKMDADLMLLFDGFSGAVGAADAAISVAKIFEAVSKLKQAGVPSNDMSCVLHPAVAYDLKANMTNTFANPNPTDLANEALRSGYVGQLAGVSVYETSNMANTGTGGDFKGGLFHKDAIGIAMLQDLKIETQRDASIRGTEIVATAVYGVGELHDSYGCEVLADSSIL